MNIPYRYVATGLVITGIGLGTWLALREEPVPVDLAEVIEAPMTVTINEEGVTRVRDVYALYAPIAGHLDRTELEPGDRVSASSSVVASIHPLDPPFIDRRTESELEAAVAATEMAVSLAQAEQERAAASRDLARAEHERAARLAVGAAISESALERSLSELRVAEAQIKAADAAIRVREAELTSVKARLSQPRTDELDASADHCCIEIHAPVDGAILSLATRSEHPVSVGSLIAEIGDPAELEIEVDVLSRDAVQLTVGTEVQISDWGGDGVLQGHITRIEPSAFEKVSALGIEERRVNVIIALDKVPESLGHGFRVYAQMVVWSSPSTLQVPLGALFRQAGEWTVFLDETGTARFRSLVIGKMNNTHAEVLAGLQVGDQVVLYPSDRVDDETAIVQR